MYYFSIEFTALNTVVCRCVQSNVKTLDIVIREEVTTGYIS